MERSVTQEIEPNSRHTKVSRHVKWHPGFTQKKGASTSGTLRRKGNKTIPYFKGEKNRKGKKYDEDDQVKCESGGVGSKNRNVGKSFPSVPRETAGLRKNTPRGGKKIKRLARSQHDQGHPENQRVTKMNPFNTMAAENYSKGRREVQNL